MSDNHFETEPPLEPKTLREALHMMLLLTADIRNDTKRIRLVHEWAGLIVGMTAIGMMILYLIK